MAKTPGYLEVALEIDDKRLKEIMDDVLAKMAAETLAEVKKMGLYRPIVYPPIFPFGTLITRNGIVNMYVGREGRHVHWAVRISGGTSTMEGLMDTIADDYIDSWKEVPDAG